MGCALFSLVPVREAARRKGDQRSSGRAIERRVEGKAIRQLAEGARLFGNFRAVKSYEASWPYYWWSRRRGRKACGRGNKGAFDTMKTLPHSGHKTHLFRS